MAETGRAHRSVEFKHQNISAVLDELGLPWIPGNIPRRNYQNAIFDAVDRYLSSKPALLEFTPALPSKVPASPFVAAPERHPEEPTSSERLRHLVRKFDPVGRIIATGLLAARKKHLCLPSSAAALLSPIALT